MRTTKSLIFFPRAALAARLLSLLPLFLALPAAAQSEDFTYTTNNGAITITEYTGPGGAVIIPDTINGQPVISVGVGAFQWSSHVASVTIGGSVSSVGERAFLHCLSLTTVIIGGGVTNIGDNALAMCSGLRRVYFQGDAPSVGQSVFGGDFGVTVYYVPGTTGWGTTLGGVPAVLYDPQTPFTYTTNGGAITITGYTAPGGAAAIPDTINGLPVTNIADSAFALSGVTGVTIGDNVTNIGAFGLTLCSSLTNITIGERVVSIGDGAFDWCSGLISLSIPNGVVSIGRYAIQNCLSLQCVTIGNGVTRIGDGTFNGCPNLTAIAVNGLNPVFKSADGVLISQETLIKCPEGKSGNFSIPNGVIGVGDSAFRLCSNLINVTFGTNVIVIGNSAFDQCTSLHSVTIPDGVATIGDSAFVECSSLTNVTFGNSVTSIGSYAFEFCTSLTGVYFRGDAPALAGEALFAFDDGVTVHCLPGTAGWGSTFSGRPTALWLPEVQTSDASFGVRTNQFGFNIVWASGQTVVVEACTNLANPVWSPLRTNTLVADSLYFGDPDWTNHPGRFYRIRSP